MGHLLSLKARPNWPDTDYTGQFLEHGELLEVCTCAHNMKRARVGKTRACDDLGLDNKGLESGLINIDE